MGGINPLEVVEEALETITKAEGPYGRDRLTHAENTITHMVMQARSALALVRKMRADAVNERARIVEALGKLRESDGIGYAQRLVSEHGFSTRDAETGGAHYCDGLAEATRIIAAALPLPDSTEPNDED
jgi:acyl-CoA reductase-like NAD-dependent aldehyde dehydrogenase